jgi:hypothetical protein
MWVCKDAAQRQCEIVVKFVAKDGKPDELIIAISAFRRLE